MPESPLLFSRSCLWFLSPSTVEKSRSAKARAGRQMGRWADRCRGIGHPLPTASDGPQAGRWRRAPQRLDSSTYRLQNRGNKARMSMKTKDKYKKSLKSRRCEARSRGQARRCLRVVTLRLSTLDSQLLDSNSTEQSENVYENKESRSSAVKKLRSCETRSRGAGLEADGLSLLDPRLST